MLKQRIDILHNAGMLHETIHCFMHQTIDYLHTTYPEVSDDKATMFITHLAMATQRILDQNIVDAMEETMFAEIKRSAGYDKALAALSYIEHNSVVAYPESERQFILLHLCNMF